METTLSWIVGLAVIAVVVLLAIGIIELRSTARALKGFLETTETSLKPALRQMQETLDSLKEVADNMTSVTENLKIFSLSAREIGQNVEKMTENVRSLSSRMGNMASFANTEVWSMKAGAKAAFRVLLRNLISAKREE